MPQFIKHVGQINSTGKKCVIIFREIPGETTSCLVVETESLPMNYHDDIINSVETDSAQQEIDFFKYATRSVFHDGRNMLEALHISGWLKKFPTSEITMKPTPDISISLLELNSQLNQLDATKTTSNDISRNLEDPVPESKPAGILDDAHIANQLRNQAAQFRSEAERLLKEADELDPPKIINTVTENQTSGKKSKRSYNKKK